MTGPRLRVVLELELAGAPGPIADVDALLEGWAVELEQLVERLELVGAATVAELVLLPRVT